MSATANQHEFKAELKQLLHLITHALYSNPEIFLRELISNASDAINKVRFDSLDRADQLEDNRDWKIKISTDRDAGTLTISDNGIGLSQQQAVENLGTIAQSGTRAFLEAMKAQNAAAKPDLIGQFGVGFYSAFMVADQVTVVSRPAGDPKNGVRWVSDGQGTYTVEPAEKATRGTDVTLHLKADAKEYLEEYRLRGLVKKFSDFIEHPVVMDVTREDEAKNKTTTEETLNARKALWLRNKSEVTDDEYKTFYQQLASDSEAPAKVVHYLAEGVNEFKVLMFIPAHRPFSFQYDDLKGGLRLYIQRVLIMEECDALLPPYLRFIKGVVDCSDLPLNISRELLQQNPTLEKIQKNIVKNALDALAALKNTEYEKYVKFYKGLGLVLKEGVSRDWNNREKIADLLLFESINTPADQYTTLADYVSKMPAEQKYIHYLIGESREVIEHSPLLEAFRRKGQDVLLLTDPIDEFMIPALYKYKDKELKAADRGEGDSDAPKPEDAGKFKPLFDVLKTKLTEVSDVRLSARLTDSAACLVADEHGPSAHLERLMRRMGQTESDEAGKRILELNGTHPAVLATQQLFEKNADDPRIEKYARLFYDQAVIAEGSKVKDPVAFAKRINELLTKDAVG
jgi:molecular chaperone HtpG